MRTRTGSRGLPPAAVALAVAVVLAWLNGLYVRAYGLDAAFFGDSADRTDYLVGSGACLATAALLLVALLVFRATDRAGWLLVLTAVGVGTQLAFGLLARHRAADAAPGPLGSSAWTGAGRALVVPGSWPLLVALLVLVVVAARDRRRVP